MNATLTISPLAVRVDAREITVDCHHGRTVVRLVPAADPTAERIHESACVRLALLRHYDEEGCGCTANLRRKYGVPS